MTARSPSPRLCEEIDTDWEPLLATGNPHARSVFRVTFIDLDVTLKSIADVLYIAESKTDLSVDGVSMAVTCYVKSYRVDAFLAAAKSLNLAVAGENAHSKMQLKKYEKENCYQFPE